MTTASLIQYLSKLVGSNSLILIVSPTPASIFNQVYTAKELVKKKNIHNPSIIILTWYRNKPITQDAIIALFTRTCSTKGISFIKPTKLFRVFIVPILFIRVKILKRFYTIISPSLRHYLSPFFSQLILTGDGFGTGNEPSYNPRLSKFRVASVAPKILNTNYLYKILPAYEDYKSQTQVNLTCNRHALKFIVDCVKDWPIDTCDNLTKLFGLIKDSTNCHRTLIVATSAFYESQRLTLESEISLYLYLIKKLLSKNQYDYIFIKLHPYDCEAKRSMLFSALEDQSIKYIILDSSPVELFISRLFKLTRNDNFHVDILGFQQVLITSYLFASYHNKSFSLYSCSPDTVKNYWPNESYNDQILFFKWISACIPLLLL